MVFVEDPWARIVGVHWDDPDDPPPPEPTDPDAKCGSFLFHSWPDDEYVEIIQTIGGVDHVYRYPRGPNAMDPVRLSLAGIHFPPLMYTAGFPAFGVDGTDIIGFDIRYNATWSTHTNGLPDTLPIWKWSPTIGFGTAPMPDPNHFPPPPEAPQHPFYAASATYLSGPIAGTVFLERASMPPDGVAFFFMYTSGQEYTPEYAAWLASFDPGPPIQPPKNGWDSNIPFQMNIDYSFALQCGSPPTMRRHRR
jgi:hypothetical protein